MKVRINDLDSLFSKNFPIHKNDFLMWKHIDSTRFNEKERISAIDSSRRINSLIDKLQFSTACIF